MSARRRCTMCWASRSRPVTVVRSTVARSSASNPMRLRKAPSLPLCGVAVTRTRCRSGLSARVRMSWYRWLRPLPPVVSSLTEPWASSTMTRSAAVRAKSWRRASDFTKSVETMVTRCRVKTDSSPDKSRSNRRMVPGSTSTGSIPNFSRSSASHWVARLGGHSTVSRRALPCSNSSAATRPASTVLPIPTSSAMSRRTVCCRRASSSGTNWYGRGVTDNPASDRNGPELARNPMRSASRSNRALRSSPRSDGSGGAKVAGSTRSRAGSTPAMSSVPPPRGRSTNRSSSLSGSTTQSRPRAVTREPTLKLGRSGVVVIGAVLRG